MEDDAVVSVKAGGNTAGKVVWKREEGLASIQDAAFMDLPTTNANVQNSNAITRMLSPLTTLAAVGLSIIRSVSQQCVSRFGATYKMYGC